MILICDMIRGRDFCEYKSITIFNVGESYGFIK